jgi:hypothetical protein
MGGMSEHGSAGEEPPSFSGHYYEGSDWDSADPYYDEVSTVKVNITTPQSNPLSTGDFYYVLLSIWDSSSSYDQIGFDAYRGVWGVVWSWNPECSSTYIFANDAFTLTPNTEYTFSMSVASGGYVDYDVYEDEYGSQTLVFSHSNQTGAAWFAAGSTWTCSGGVTAYDYTDYEEIWSTSNQNFPDFDFHFTGNSLTPYSCKTKGCPGSWNVFTLAPSGYSFPTGVPTPVAISGGSTYIENEWFNESVTPGPGLWTLGIGQVEGYEAVGSVAGEVEQVCTSSCDTSSASISKYSGPSGWTYKFNATTGSFAFHWDVEMEIPCCQNAGSYTITIEAISSGTEAFVQFIVTLTAASSGGGGGGCVALGTQIMTPGGYQIVQNLRVGESVVGYNFSTNLLVSLTLLGLNSTLSSPLVVINNGMLTLTATDQPVYAKNTTFQGWILNPDQLQVGAFVWDPVTTEWIAVTSMSEITHDVRVYDVVTSGINDFIANGVLLDIKTP